MCNNISWGDDALYCLTDLRRVGLRVEPSDYTWECEGETFVNGEDSCFCNVAIEAVLDRSGVKYRDDLGDLVVTAAEVQRFSDSRVGESPETNQ